MRAMILMAAGTLLGLWLGRADAPPLNAADEPAKADSAKSDAKEKQRLEPPSNGLCRQARPVAVSPRRPRPRGLRQDRQGRRIALRLSQAEQWRISNDALYKQHSAEFLRAAKQLTKGAKDSNLDAALARLRQAHHVLRRVPPLRPQ